MPLADLYRAYIGCLNRQDWPGLGRFVAEDVEHNGRRLGLPGYRDMLVRDFTDIADLRFEIGMLVCEPPNVAARLLFDCTPEGQFLGLAVDRRRITFAENVFYVFRNDRIASVWSVIDKAAIEAQLPRR
ncbi:ester cyclase [Lichenicoccus roseus]|uniref:Ester cyclase n=1 Tax=Lichenicoccus roseus TaxID=2683649 RepID=A0A5R9JBS9_9PROT|nr:ester cyclase [Lichenicoccus roseus]TLU74203.1 ester cyclase [Lichenicoccus roseus]